MTPEEETFIILSEPTPVMDEFGNKRWHKNGQRHRENDLPAVIWADGAQFWYKNGEFHRDNGLPALIYANGKEEFYINGKQIK